MVLVIDENGRRRHLIQDETSEEGECPQGWGSKGTRKKTRANDVAEDYGEPYPMVGRSPSMETWMPPTARDGEALRDTPTEGEAEKERREKKKCARERDQRN